jgi:alpha-L-rhamnosidase
MYGRAASDWKLAGDQLHVSATVPANTHATIRLPGATLAAVTEGGRTVAGAPGIGAARQDGAAVVVEAGSGTYAFAYPAAGLRLPGPSLPATQP